MIVYVGRMVRAASDNDGTYGAVVSGRFPRMGSAMLMDLIESARYQTRDDLGWFGRMEKERSWRGGGLWHWDFLVGGRRTPGGKNLGWRPTAARGQPVEASTSAATRPHRQAFS